MLYSLLSRLGLDEILTFNLWSEVCICLMTACALLSDLARGLLSNSSVFLGEVCVSQV